jgi:hypothetical protein
LKLHTLFCARVRDYPYWRYLVQPESANYILVDPKPLIVKEVDAGSSAPRNSVYSLMPQ